MDEKREEKMGLVVADPALARQLAEAPDRSYYKQIWAGYNRMAHVGPVQIKNVTLHTKIILLQLKVSSYNNLQICYLIARASD